MIFDKVAYNGEFDLAIYGLGYESRSVLAFKKYSLQSKRNIAIGYETNNNAINYKENKNFFEKNNIEIYENDCESIIKKVKDIVEECVKDINEPKVFIDITVMSRHRMANIIFNLLTYLCKSSKITICYNFSDFVEPPSGLQPVKEMGPIIEGLHGDLGDLSMPTSIVFGLGYEEHKALGVYNYYDADYSYAFVPQNPYSKFEPIVRENNAALLDVMTERNTFTYNITNPYATYIDLKSLVLSLTDISRVILVPLGPKIFAALAVILGKELYPKLPVWRVSSLHSEPPVERNSHNEVLFSLTI